MCVFSNCLNKLDSAIVSLLLVSIANYRHNNNKEHSNIPEQNIVIGTCHVHLQGQLLRSIQL